MDFEEEVEFHLNHLRDHGFTIVKNVRLRQRHPTVTHPGPPACLTPRIATPR